jgi:hypothetical protein
MAMSTRWIHISGAVDAQRLSHLKAGFPHRVEVRHRILRHVTDAGAANGPHPARVGCGDVGTVENDPAAGDSPARR